MSQLEAAVRSAWDRGADIDLEGVGYGRIHWGNEEDVAEYPFGYYRTLAGFAALSQSRTALEIGTHWGGSAVALLRGMRVNHPDATIVTLDILRESDNWLPHQPEAPAITKIVGDANTASVIEATQKASGPVDLLYVDADHWLMPTLITFSIYTALFRPRFAMFDDIHLNDEMSAFWSTLRRAYPDHTINCAEVVPETRNPAPGCGFGLWVSPERGWDRLSGFLAKA